LWKSGTVSPPEYCYRWTRWFKRWVLSYANTSTNGEEQEVKWLYLGAGAQWSSNFMTEGIVAIKFDVSILSAI
jgi:hypothetical protein